MPGQQIVQYRTVHMHEIEINTEQLKNERIN